jgi:cytidyltransferase-like protein
MIIYVDGVFDMFHRGHLESFKYIKTIYPSSNNKLIVGIINDKDCQSYKREPIINEKDRSEIVKSIKYVDDIIFPAPLIITEEFIKKYNIDKIVHGFSSEKDELNQQILFQIPIRLGIFEKITYYDKLSTTDIIKKIKDL